MESFSSLRESGLRLIERLAQSQWTDHNAHDPGITILEQVCYALTDLEYRLDHPIRDLVVSGGSTRPIDWLAGASSSLACQPVTLEDYRKVVMDVAGVRNAWVEPLEGAELGLAFDPLDQTLYRKDPKQAPHRRPVAPRGIQRVLVEAERGWGLEVDLEVLKGAVTRRLGECRGLGLDFEKVVILEQRGIRVNARIEMSPERDPEALLAEILVALEDSISPRVRFHSLAELLRRGRRIDEVIEGPLLEHGFIDAKELEACQRVTSLRASDLIRVMMDVPGVRAVNHMVDVRMLTHASGMVGDDWYLELDPKGEPRVPILDWNASNLVLSRGGMDVPLEKSRVIQLFEAQRSVRVRSQASEESRDLARPTGRNRNVGRYSSIQNQLPQIYGTGEFGLPRNASPERQAQARQLQAYLCLFDQILANSFSQLALAPTLFSPEPSATYLAQSLTDVPRGEELMADAPGIHARSLQDLVEEPASAQNRRLKFLGHLLARFGEEAADLSLASQEGNSPRRPDAVVSQSAFLRDCVEISANRNRAFNRTEPAWEVMMGSANISGLEWRICRKLGLAETRRRRLADLSDMDEGGFHLVEHILLRPADEGVHGGPLLAEVVTEDPYSDQVTFVLPDFLRRFANPNFRILVERTLREETPAHLRVRSLWFGREEMRDFEDAFGDWLNSLTLSV